MGNTTFYKDIKKNTVKITWKDLFTDIFKKHSQEDILYTLTAGTKLNTADESNMLQRWHKPWLWFYILVVGAALFICTTAMREFFPRTYHSLEAMHALLPLLVITFSGLVLLWELDIPRDISILDLALYMVLGALPSLVIAVPLFKFVSESWKAPVAEEPAKLGMALLGIWLFSKKGRRIYGITGLVIGAAVGSGFTLAESLGYILRYFGDGANIGIIRGLGALSGHMLYAAPYAAAVALHMKKNRITAESFLNQDFVLAFAFACALHAFNNAGIDSLIFGNNETFEEFCVFKLAKAVVAWAFLLYILRKCLKQVVEAGNYRSGEGEAFIPSGIIQGSDAHAGTAEKACYLICTAGPLSGAVWELKKDQVMNIGRQETNEIIFSSEAKGVSRAHCCVEYRNGGWQVTDRKSTYGTYTSRYGKLEPGETKPLYADDMIYLGSKKNQLQLKVQ